MMSKDDLNDEVHVVVARSGRMRSAVGGHVLIEGRRVSMQS